MTDQTTDFASAHVNPDPLTGAPGSHPGATAIGSASGAATGAALGALAGPIGAVIGGITGAAVGGGIGHSVGEANDPSVGLIDLDREEVLAPRPMATVMSFD